MYAYSRATLTSNSCVCVYGEPKTRQQGAHVRSPVLVESMVDMCLITVMKSLADSQSSLVPGKQDNMSDKLPHHNVRCCSVS